MADAQTVSISFYLPVQVALLVLFYGNIMPTLPMWLVWLPTLLLLGIVGVALIVIVIIFIIAVLGNR